MPAATHVVALGRDLLGLLQRGVLHADPQAAGVASGSTDDPACCAHSVPAWKYVTKSTDSSRSSVSVNDDIPTLKSPARTDGMIALEPRLAVVGHQTQRPRHRIHQVDVEADDLPVRSP